MEDIINDIAITHKFPLRMIHTGGKIELPVRGAHICKLDIGPDALEWYVSVYEFVDGKEVWSTWEDYLGYHDNKSEAQLIDDKRRDITTFIEAWLHSTDSRITRTKSKFFLFKLFSITNTDLELYIDGKWEVAPLYDPSR